MKISRREFIRGVAGLTLTAPAAALTGSCKAQLPKRPAEPAEAAKVVLVRDEHVLDDQGRLDAGILRRMLDDAVAALVDESDAAAAWKNLVRPSDTVGIKSNVWRFLRTPPELERIIEQRVIDAGVPPKRIAIDDRGVLRNPVFQQSTALINVRPMRTHHWSGVGSLIKNYIMFSPSPPDWHGDSCADLAGLWELPVVKGKTRLNVLVMLAPLFQSTGPHDFSARFTWPYRGLLVGRDPVATDATGLRILRAKRLEFFGEDRPFEVLPKHVRVAEQKFGLGVADPARIQVAKLGWRDGVLV